MHELGVAHALLAGGGVDADDPEAAEVALAPAAIAKRVVPRAHDLLVREAVARVLAAVVALGLVEDLLLPLLAGDSIGCASHGATSSSRAGGLRARCPRARPLWAWPCGAFASATSSPGCGWSTRGGRGAFRSRSCESASLRLSETSASAWRTDY